MSRENMLMNSVDKIDGTETSSDSAAELTPEDIKFGQSHPFKTIINLSLLPAIFQTMGSLHDALDLVIMRKAYGSEKFTIFSIASILKMLVINFSSLHSGSLTYKISQFSAQHKFREAGQLFADYFRINILVAIVIPVIFGFAQKPFMSMLGLPADMMKEATTYVVPLYLLIFFLSTVSCLRSAISGIARPTFAYATQMFSIIISLCIATPIVSLGFHWPIWTAQFAFNSGEVICFFVLMFMLVRGKFSIEFEWKMLIMKPSPDLGSALLLSLPSLVIIPLGMLSPAVTLEKMNAATGKNTDIATTLSTGSKPMTIVMTLLKSLLGGLSSAGTYAFNKKLFSRVKQLFFFSLVIPMAILVVTYPILIKMPNLYMQIWLPDEKYKKYIDEYIPLFFYGCYFDVIAQAFFFLMLVMNTPFNALAEAVCKYAFQIVISLILAAIYPTDARKIGYAYVLTSTADVVLSILFLTCPFYKYLKNKNDSNDQSNMNEQVSSPLIE